MKHAESDASRTGKEGGQLLIVDDDPEVRRILRRLFEPDYEVIEAEDGLAAWEIIPAHSPAILVTDVEMPRLDGLSLCRKLRERGFEGLRIVLYTGREISVQETRAAGADEFLLKTAPLSRLRELVEQLRTDDRSGN